MLFVSNLIVHTFEMKQKRLFRNFRLKAIVVSKHLVSNQDFRADFFVFNEFIQFCVSMQHYCPYVFIKATIFFKHFGRLKFGFRSETFLQTFWFQSNTFFQTLELKAILHSKIVYSWKDSLRSLLFQSKTFLESVWSKSNTLHVQ